MAKTYAQIVKQIEALQLEADKIRRKEVDGVISQIRQSIRTHKLSAQDLGFGGDGKSSAPRKAAAKRKVAKTVVVKFRNEAGGTWAGRGKRPQWLRDALAAGKQLSDFAVN